MPLTYDLGEIADYKTKCLDENGCIRSVTERIIFMTMAVDVGEIKDSNWREFAVRAHMLGLFDECVRPMDIKRHIGLRCNVASISNVQFKTKLNKILRRKADRFICTDEKNTIQEVGDAIAELSQADGGNARSA